MKVSKRDTPRASKPAALKHALRLQWDEKHAQEHERRTRYHSRHVHKEEQPVNWRDWIDPATGRFTIPKTKGEK